MTRNNSVNFTGPLQYPIADAATDLFKKEDVQVATKALDLHDHSTGKGVAIPFSTAIPNGTITSAMIADGTIDTADLKDGSVTSLKIADGTIATVDLANASVTNAKLGPDTARANLLTNGGFEVWQRGNGPFTGAGTYNADRWLNGPGAGSTFSAMARDQSNMDANSSSCLACTYSHAAESFIFQKNEDFSQLRGRTLTFSIRVRTSTANAVRPLLQQSGTNTYGSYHSGGGAYETLTVTLAVPAGATSVVCGVSLAASCTFYLDNAMLVVGSQAADYAPLHPADDQARCLRYYEVLCQGNIGLVTGQAFAGTGVQALVGFKVPKVNTPTVTVSAPGDFYAFNATAATQTLTSFSVVASNVTTVMLNGGVASGLVAGNASNVGGLNANARLTAESNP